MLSGAFFPTAYNRPKQVNHWYSRVYIMGLDVYPCYTVTCVVATLPRGPGGRINPRIAVKN